MIVVFIYGPTASGKHTIGSLLSEMMGLPLFHNHLTVDLAMALFEFGAAPFVRLRAKVWRASFAEAAAEAQSFIFTFHPESTVDPQLIQDLIEVVESSGGRVCFVELSCSRAAVLQRLGNESRARFGKLMDRSLYEQIEQQGGFEFPPLPKPIVTIDTEKLSAEQAATQIQRTLTGVA